MGILQTYDHHQTTQNITKQHNTIRQDSKTITTVISIIRGLASKRLDVRISACSCQKTERGKTQDVYEIAGKITPQ
jgi:hypothetical protein